MPDMQARFDELVRGLVDQVAVWAKDAGWVTKPYPKRMRARNRSVFEIPALYLQRGPTQLLLDPIAFDVPGSEAVVDLYLMPTYDDMASLYFREGRWTIHYAFPCDSTADASMDKVASLPLDGPNLLRILDAIATYATPSV
jgi:hypothetical protein